MSKEPRKWALAETAFGPDIVPFDPETDARGLTFEEARTIIVKGLQYTIRDWLEYTEEECIAREAD